MTPSIATPPRADVPFDVVIGIGANLGDRASALAAAIDAVAALPATRLLARSVVRETAPVGGPAQGRFLNAAIRLSTSLAPAALLGELLTIERRLGRVRRERWGPRVIDLDVLWVRGVGIRSPGLTVPHPRLAEREFALAPLVEIVPDARDPISGALYADVLAKLCAG